MTIVEQLDEGARRILAAQGFAAKLAATAYILHAVKGWATNNNRDGVADVFASAAGIADELGERLGRLATARRRW